jgi:hypothetical protein
LRGDGRAAAGLFRVAFATDAVAVMSATGPSPSDVLVLLTAHADGHHVAWVFFGLWPFLLGYLVFRSGFCPRALGVVVMAVPAQRPVATG